MTPIKIDNMKKIKKRKKHITRNELLRREQQAFAAKGGTHLNDGAGGELKAAPCGRDRYKLNKK